MSTKAPHPGNMGRILRDEKGRLSAVVEAKDASDAQLKIQEVNTGVMALSLVWLHQHLHRLDCQNAQQEYYLTDTVQHALAQQHAVACYQATDWQLFQGVNTFIELADLNRIYQRRYAAQLMAQGVHIADPSRFDCQGVLCCEGDVFIDVGVIIKGPVTLGAGVTIGAYCVLDSVTIAEGATILPHSVLSHVTIDQEASVGPFAYLRPGTHLEAKSKVGAFVEVKNTRLGRGSKANHLTYLGDATIGRQVNIGAGVVICNYDGQKKHQTVVGDGVFVGSGTQLIAPITIAKGAVVAAGSCVHRPVQSAMLVMTYVDASGQRQQVIQAPPTRFVAR